MKDILKFIFIPKLENAKKIFEKALNKKGNIILFLSFIGIFSVLIFGSSVIKFLYNGSFSQGFALMAFYALKSIFLYFSFIIVGSFILFFITKAFRGKGSFIDNFLSLNISFVLLLLSSSLFYNILGIKFAILGVIWFLIIFGVLFTIILGKVWKSIILIFLVILSSYVGYEVIKYRTIKNFEQKAENSLRVANLNTLSFKVELYFSKYEKLPESIGEIIYERDFLTGEIKKIIDKKDGKIINGCQFGYNYEKISEKKFRLFACLEGKDGKKLSKEDDGYDDKVYEVIKEL